MSEVLPPHAGDAAPKRRDVLGHFCFLLHLGVMLFIVGGWAMPYRGALLFYLVFLPLVALQWQFNNNSCVLNNFESLIRTGRWRDPSNEEEGAWFLSLVKMVLGIEVRPVLMDAFIYVVLAALWAGGLAHLLGLGQSGS
jgi:hypothetical protein